MIAGSREVNLASKLEKRLVGAAGIEPATLGLEIRCSIHLSYAPSMIWVLTLTDIFTNVLLVVGRALAAATST